MRKIYLSNVAVDFFNAFESNSKGSYSFRVTLDVDSINPQDIAFLEERYNNIRINEKGEMWLNSKFSFKSSMTKKEKRYYTDFLRGKTANMSIALEENGQWLNVFNITYNSLKKEQQEVTIDQAA